MKVYICGPRWRERTHDVDEAARKLRDAGYSPVSVPILRAGSGRINLRSCVGLLVGCDSVCALPGCDGTREGRALLRVARDVGIPVRSLASMAGK